MSELHPPNVTVPARRFVESQVPLVHDLRADALDLECVCPVCAGRGVSEIAGHLSPCCKCHGARRIPTSFGEALLDFLGRNLRLREVRDD